METLKMILENWVIFVIMLALLGLTVYAVLRFLKARKLLYQYCEIEGYAYNGTLTNFKRRGSIVEYLAIKNMILEVEREKISNIIDGVKSC